MHRVIYDFDVKPDCAPEFEGLVADWFNIMKQREGFIAISLFRSTVEDDRFCAISDWASEKAYEAFHSSAEHARVAEATGRLFTTEKRNAYDLVYQVTMRECDS
jgi:quinol monooxygenase YgiN